MSKLEEKYKSNWKFKFWASRSKLSECLAKKSEEVHSLCMDGIFERGVVVDKSVKPVEKIVAPNIEDKQSLRRAFQNTLNSLRSDKIRKLESGELWGLGKQQ